MFETDQYELLDFGDGRKLERFGATLLDRPMPAAADCAKQDKSFWPSADACFQRTADQQGVWKPAKGLPSSWCVAHHKLVFQLKPTDFGHVGLFPEQAENWDWITRQVRRASQSSAGKKIKVLNLFAYTGGSTLAAAAAGAEVVHVDGAKNVVAWARSNAELSGLSAAPVRWITEDAAMFVRRELRRGNQYDAVILDPPSYGHGPKGEPWKLTEHLMPLLTDLGQLTARRRAFMLLSCHSAGFGPAELEACFAEAIVGHCQSGAQAKPLLLRSTAGKELHCGTVVRWPA